MEQKNELIKKACQVRQNSYSPYSNFRVGAALLTGSGTVYAGTNVENASFGLSICAERAAIFQAVAAGEKDFLAMAICADGSDPTPPCGACRQVLMEFGPEMPLYLAGGDGLDGLIKDTSVTGLLPEAFVTFKGNTTEESQ